MTKTRMQAGWMWLDARKGQTLEQKVLNAVKKYQTKHGHTPDTCYVHSSAIEEERQVGSVRVIPVRNIPLHHLWLGVSD